MEVTLIDSLFRQDVIRGLSAPQKYLLPKYFYDATGDALFQQIMHCPEYYLTRAETEILQQKSGEILQACTATLPVFDIVELGAGDASKTIYLLQEALARRCSRQYIPIDISASMIAHLNRSLPAQLPGMRVSGLCGEYIPMLAHLQTSQPTPKLVLFLGATIGNLLPDEASAFFRSLHTFLNPGDYVLTGFDLKKNPQLILDAYNDKGGLTRAFNLNLLERINRELGGNFEADAFNHFPVYDPMSGACKSYLISTCQQRVTLDDGTHFDFDRNEPIYMEVSQKYSVAEIGQLGRKAGFTPVETYFDSERLFADVLFTVAYP
ncbi:L-histidine N(alpha)-methyltransferase [Spirosoma montaniterrae]|uniref:Dimethylhistidine N-methyltransferase n=1 Tax=Spirosoma montaniterrae TaxID=1178516 RepID=A0A1P9WTC4_9BACT|nr:L-histidine N(alpha)-methyltransferase [Spirosoma montaniterrae]AQG78631.1 dimethylhistidine N-methyltransferase [Spirosoma montaniterrae]